MNLARRREEWGQLERQVFDVVIVGGGINGACLYHHLCAAGHSVLLLDRGDFAGGTSQASGMMIWGGLLYLRNWDLLTVRRLCTARDGMLRQMGDWIQARPFRYCPTNGNGHSKPLVHAGLYLYWLLGGCARRRPRSEPVFAERAFLRPEALNGSLVYEEASVVPSDARFVLGWLLPHRNAAQQARNYCSLEGGTFDPAVHAWRLEVDDRLIQRTHSVRARWVVNAAGVWADAVNRRFGMETPYKHVFSKGVFIGLRRDSHHQLPLVFDTRTDGDAMALIPWGSVSLWGPTETFVPDPACGFAVESDDVRSLLAELNLHLARPVTPADIVSLRCGVRALAVKRSFRKHGYPLDLSRKHLIHCDRRRPWISIYGGKLTGCVDVARTVQRRLQSTLRPSRVGPASLPPAAVPQDRASFPGVRDALPSARWCAREEMCWNLEDYLRRRTNIAQWVARGGLGADNENAARLVDLAQAFSNGDPGSAQAAVATYRCKVEREFDQILAQC